MRVFLQFISFELLINIVILVQGTMIETDNELVGAARDLFALMIREKDRDKRVDLKIEINSMCLKGKFDYHNSVYAPMVAIMEAEKRAEAQ
jgi:hypothetical protein